MISVGCAIAIAKACTASPFASSPFPMSMSTGKKEPNEPNEPRLKDMDFTEELRFRNSSPVATGVGLSPLPTRMM